MQIRFFLPLLLGIISINAFSQTKESVQKPNYLTIQTGLIVDNYNSLGIRAFFEYQEDIKSNWQYGISYEHSTHFASFASDHVDELSTNLNLMSLNGYYKLNLYKNRVFWITGLGIGVVHANWNEHNKIGVTVNTSMTLNIRITKKLYFESSPLIVFLPSNRIYLSTMDLENYKNFYAFSFFPFGLKIML